MSPLTKRQHEVLAFIVNSTKEHGYAPSVREIADGVGVSSPATVHEHLEALRLQGYLRRERERSMRSWIPTALVSRMQSEISNLKFEIKRAIASVELPLVGLITAGTPIEAIQERETIGVPADFVVDGMNSYVLRVKGESMIEDGILNGDYVVVERNPSPKNGDVVVALLDNAYATLKKFYRERNRIRLQPANRTMEPIYVRDCIVQGIVKAVMRRYAPS